MKDIFEKLRITPGPWKYDMDRDTDDYIIFREGAAQRHNRIVDEGGVIGSSEWIWASEPDIRLMTASPEMFLWIRGMMECAENDDMVRGAHLLALAPELLKKASGVSFDTLKELRSE